MNIVRKPKNLPPAMIGTAGHVDHGKTFLVKHLTGCDTDQLKEEKERGLSINLGFAPCALSGERMVGIVDVPGHIDFIRNMVTGAASIDLLILVVAADDGIMPQTVEHLQIIKMLSLPRLVVALTKIDLVDHETAELAEEEIAEFLAEMGFQDVPVMPVSNVSGAGISELKEKIEELVGELELKHDPRRFRMNVQKHFSVKGLGTVATGIPISGELRLNDPLELMPAGTSTSVRTIQNYKLQTDHTGSRICCALNLRDVGEEELERGMTLAVPEAYKAGTAAIVTVKNISKKFILKHKYLLRFHSGTFETNAKISIVGGNLLKPGEKGFASLVFEAPVVLAANDTFILRESSPSMTVGGGKVLLPESFRFKRSSEAFKQRLQEAEIQLEKQDFLAAQLLVAPSPYQSHEQLVKISCLEETAAEEPIAGKVAEGFLADLTGDCYLVNSRSGEMRERVVKILAKHHAGRQYSWGLDPRTLGTSLGLKSSSATGLIKFLTRSFSDFRFSHGRLSLASFSPAITGKQMQQKETIFDRISAAGNDCVSLETMVAELAIPKKEFRLLANILVEEEEIVVLGKYYMTQACFNACLEAFRKLAVGKNVVGIKEYRDQLNTGRNITVTILEKLDSLGITQRVPDGRTLVPRSGSPA